MQKLPRPLDETRLIEELDTLGQQCKTVRHWLKEYGYPKPRLRPRGFATLAQAICGQQISVKAAAAIWARLEHSLEAGITAESVQALGYDPLRAVGFSHRKAEYLLGLADAIHTGALDIDALTQETDTSAIARLTKLRGFGPWTAQIYLMFAEGRGDIWPHDDIALQEGLKLMFDLKERPKGKESLSVVEHWQPFRSAGALLVWHVYGSTTLG